MAWTDGGGLSTGTSKVSSNTVALTVSDTPQVGDVVIVQIASDNTSTSDGDNSEVQSVVDARGNSYAKAREFTNAQSGAAAGVTISLWYSVLTTALQINDAITATFVSDRTAKVIGARFFSINGDSVEVVTGDSLANDGADPGSMDLTVPNAEHLWVRAIAHEGNSGDLPMTRTASYQLSLGDAGTTGGGAASNICSGSEWDIFTGTSNASDPSWTTVDHASVLVAFKEVTGASNAYWGSGGWI